MLLSFSKNKKLLNSQQFKTVLEQRNSARDSLLLLYAAENDTDFPRIGISIRKSIGKAALRNILKRLIREAFRVNQLEIPKLDYIVMMSPQWFRTVNNSQSARLAIKKITMSHVQRSFLKLAHKAAQRYDIQNGHQTEV